MNIFQESFRAIPGFKSLDSCLRDKITPVCVSGLAQIHKAQLLIATCENKTTLVITDDDNSARKLAEDINQMTGEQTAHYYPSREYTMYTAEGISREYEFQRLGILANILDGNCRIVIAGAEAVMQIVPPQDIITNRSFTISENSETATSELAMKLIMCGYSRTDKIEGVSQFSIRGSIVDIFSPHAPYPYRLEFWGDEVDSISYFDIETQRRTDSLKEIKIVPAREVLFDSDELCEKIEKLTKSSRGKYADVFKENSQSDIAKLKSGILIENADKYINLIYPEKPSLFDYIDGNIYISELSHIVNREKGIKAQYNEDIKLLLEEGMICRSLCDHYVDFQQILMNKKDRCCIYINSFFSGADKIEYKQIINIDAIQTSTWGGEMRQLAEDLKEYCDRDYTVILMAGSEKTLPIIADDLRNSGFNVEIVTDKTIPEKKKIHLMCGSISAGFDYPEIKYALITQTKTAVSKRKKLKQNKKGKEIRGLSDVTPGDLVVHALHGIGRFVGIKKLELEGITKDYITIQYAGKDVLYVPVTQLDMVSKYIGGRDDTGVKLNKLSSLEWQKTRNNVKRAVKDMAAELIALYAKRQNTEGFAFSPDNEMQRDFENRFPHVETNDQLQSISEIKHDMEKPYPMDRLLCGDVGFGKTEVAFRAAFKCIFDGKQCAILTPTTVLAWQHYQTALKRFEHFPVRIELLSRFRTPAQQKQILKDLKAGKIDMIIGTHRLVQKDVQFKALGLAIVDEEQRFGIAHKEKFKENFIGVDVLTLSATPIPRTLNMAMSGIRDMSVIEEPPQDRYPVQTYVIEHNMGVILQAITKELKRGGQVYYIHNRVETIAGCAATLKELLPEARITYAHGQMGEEKMSETWQQLLEHEIDILISTTIIETGVDVPNVNTLIIEDADKFGLSQLYQLRGRVGRSNRRASAYFTFKRGKVLTEVASKRLEAIREFTQFGSGFRIAMRDLEIRGAGSILSGKQHGHIETVGYDMYLKLLSDAIAEERGDVQEKKAEDCVVDIQIDAHIPEKYIESMPQRIDAYKKIAIVQTQEDSEELIDEFIDRYGEPPKAIIGLINISLLRNTAARLGITEISQRNGCLLFYIASPEMSQIKALSANFKGRVMFNSLAKPYISVKLLPHQKPELLISDVIDIMNKALTAEETK
ncbi:MAG: transcription-repair coupling factor [Oscillospiraceae bacterium]|nr:transcription-repair coupling factor [Oscillospiraceae bacterium]MBR6599173.1 transcription-repair coupling factor [Oscillospiraceae bacterium]